VRTASGDVTIETAEHETEVKTASGDVDVRRLVNDLYARIDWRWALNGGTTLTHGWKPETGFITWRWDSYAELMGMYLLGIGAPGKALPPDVVAAINSAPEPDYASVTDEVELESSLDDQHE